MVDILFATNRVPAANTPQDVPDFGDQALPATPGSLWCGTASVDGVTTHDPDAGTIAAIPDLHQGGFSEAQLAALTNSTNDIVVFVHGTDNAFADAVARAAYNKTWLDTVAGQSIDVIAFSWPARAYGSLVDVFNYPDDYKDDQQEASASAFHFGLFLEQLYTLRPQFGTRKLSLLCHSMGNFMLGAAVEAWYANGHTPAQPLFDVAILAAADETADTFNQPNGGRLSNLHRVAKAIIVYFSDNDILMAASNVVNDRVPLGMNGATDEANTQFFSTAVYQFCDCSNAADFVGPRLSLDLSHQYYRQSPTVRADIAALLLGKVPKRYFYDPTANIYELFAPPLPFPVA